MTTELYAMFVGGIAVGFTIALLLDKVLRPVGFDEIQKWCDERRRQDAATRPVGSMPPKPKWPPIVTLREGQMPRGQ